MATGDYHYAWTWDLESPPETLWPLVADTNRFNRDTDLPTVRDVPAAAAVPNRRWLTFRKFGLTVRWEEQPFEWVRPQRFSVVRRYLGGPVTQMVVRVELAARPGGGTRLDYRVWITPRNLLARVAVPIQVGLLAARSFDAAFRRYDRLLRSAPAEATLLPPGPVVLARGGAERLSAAAAELAARRLDPALIDRLLATLRSADDLAAAHLRPFALADLWHVPRRNVLELCLHATRAGLLDLQWDLLCPLCRGAKLSAAALSALPGAVHCDACRIDYTAGFDRNLELTFRPSAAIRELSGGAYCVGGPQVTPHIVAQQLLAAGESRTLSLALEPGRHRLRVAGQPGGLVLAVEAASTPSSAGTTREPLGVDLGEPWPTDDRPFPANGVLTLANRPDAERLVTVERLAWTDQAATAADVTALQAFRDLYSREALRPGEGLEVARLAVLFTDLKGSTRLYRQIGDAPAFGRVMTHFDVLRDAIAAHDGAIVKTIGDAVMAVFRRPLNAVLAVRAARQRLADPGDTRPPLVLKAGIHLGPCIAVTQNERLDYFGSTVNFAARLTGQAHGAELVLSQAVRDDPEVDAWLVEQQADVRTFEAELRGFDPERFALYAV